MGSAEASLDASCSLEISSLDAAECSEGESTVQASGETMVIVISVGVAASVVLLILMVLVSSLVICSLWKRRRGASTMDTEKK